MTLIVLMIVALVTSLVISGVGIFAERKDAFQAIQDIRNLEISVQLHFSSRSIYPETPADVGMGGLRGPWGKPCF